MALSRVLLLFLLLIPSGSTAAQQNPPLKLSVQQNGREIGREEFTLTKARARGLGGTTLTSTASYPAVNPATRLNAVLERTPDFAIAKFQLEVDSADGTTVILAAGSGARLIVRTVARGSESGRELPGGPDVVLLDDGVYSLYSQLADLATPSGRQLTAIYPRTGRRATFNARREAGGNGGASRTALSGDVTGTLVTDAEGRLERLELPGRSITVTRMEQGPPR
jgi:hypothetical protein